MIIYLTVVIWLAFTLTMLLWLDEGELPGPGRVFINLIIAALFPIILLYILITISDKDVNEDE